MIPILYHTWLFVLLRIFINPTCGWGLTLLVMASEMDPESWGGGSRRPIEKSIFWVSFFFPKVHIKLGKVKFFQANQIKNGAVIAIFR